MSQLLLNSQPFRPSKDLMPMALHYMEGEGGSLCSVLIISSLLQQGEKALFFTAYPMAKDLLMDDLEGSDVTVCMASSLEELDDSADCIIVESGNVDLCITILGMLASQEDRIVFLKNVELYPSSLLKASITYPLYLLSGDLTSVPLNKDDFSSVVLFSPLAVLRDEPLLELSTYHARLFSTTASGDLSVSLSS